MSRVRAAMLMAAFAFAPYAAYGQDESGARRDDRPRSQQDLMRESEQACKGLKGDARAECLANYVGPLHDRPSGAWKRPPNPPRPQGRT
ncbi:MAG TPA: hypothetical protein VMH26_01365 [Burkholderiales bacterium]|nr:hypothetical protein [Burkholderiales bacterium]